MDIGQRTMLFANPFDDLSGQRIARKSCCSHESTLIEEAMKHGNYSILVRLFKIQNRLRNSNIIAEVNQEAENPLSPSVFFCAFSYRFPLKLISKQGEQWLWPFSPYWDIQPVGIPSHQWQLVNANESITPIIVFRNLASNSHSMEWKWADVRYREVPSLQSKNFLSFSQWWWVNWARKRKVNHRGNACKEVNPI